MKEIIVALVSPFDKKGQLDYPAIDKIIEYNLDLKADGFFIGGSAGEGILLTLEEKIELFKYISKYNSKCKIIANISSTNSKEAIILGSLAKELNYYAMSSVIPYYYKHSMESIVKYYEDIMESVDLPMIIYNFPLNSGVNFDLNNKKVKQLFRDERVIGVKHTNHDLYELERIMRINPNLNYYCGYDEIYLSSLVLGVRGAIGSTFNVSTKQFKAIGDLYERGQLDEALKLQKEFNILMDEFIDVGLIPGIKYTLELLGLCENIVRSPFIELNDSKKLKLQKEFEVFNS